MKVMGISDKITLIIVLIAGMVLLVLSASVLIPNVAVLISNKKTVAKVERIVTDEYGRYYVIFSYDNIYDKDKYTIEKALELEKDKNYLVNKTQIEVCYNKYFPEDVKILNVGSSIQIFMQILAVCIFSFSCYRSTLGLLGKLKVGDIL